MGFRDFLNGLNEAAEKMQDRVDRQNERIEQYKSRYSNLSESELRRRYQQTSGAERKAIEQLLQGYSGARSATRYEYQRLYDSKITSQLKLEWQALEEGTSFLDPNISYGTRIDQADIKVRKKVIYDILEGRGDL